MTKKIFVMIILLSLFCFGIFLLASNKQARAIPPALTPLPITRAATEAAQVCKVITGVQTGRVNLRSCAGTSCPVLLVLSDGQALKIIQAGAWNKVITDDGATGFINSFFCREVNHD